MKHIPLIRPYIHFDDVEDDFAKVFSSGIFTKGENVSAFQSEFSQYVGVKHTHMTTSATTALWVCLKMLDISVGDEVIVSDFSFPASSNVVEDLGAVPIFADVSIDTYNMRPDDLSKKITNKTKAVIFVDALGNPAGLSEIQDICTAHGIPLIEDAACAIGSSEHNRKCGSIADLTCFSFHPRKLLCTGEGGAITTQNDQWAEWLRVKLNHGADGLVGKSLNFVEYGYNFRLPELQSIMGRKQLPHLDTIIADRRHIRDEYAAGIAPLGYIPQFSGNSAHHNIQSLVFRVPESIVRDHLMDYLKTQGVESSIGTYALSAVTYNKNKYNAVQPVSQKLFETTITLPCYQDVDVQYVIEKIKEYHSAA